MQIDCKVFFHTVYVANISLKVYYLPPEICISVSFPDQIVPIIEKIWMNFSKE